MVAKAALGKGALQLGVLLPPIDFWKVKIVVLKCLNAFSVCSSGSISFSKMSAVSQVSIKARIE